MGRYGKLIRTLNNESEAKEKGVPDSVLKAYHESTKANKQRLRLAFLWNRHVSLANQRNPGDKTKEKLDTEMAHGFDVMLGDLGVEPSSTDGDAKDEPKKRIFDYRTFEKLGFTYPLVKENVNAEKGLLDYGGKNFKIGQADKFVPLWKEKLGAEVSKHLDRRLQYIAEKAHLRHLGTKPEVDYVVFDAEPEAEKEERGISLTSLKTATEVLKQNPKVQKVIEALKDLQGDDDSHLDTWQDLGGHAFVYYDSETRDGHCTKCFTDKGHYRDEKERDSVCPFHPGWDNANISDDSDDSDDDDDDDDDGEDDRDYLSDCGDDEEEDSEKEEKDEEDSEDEEEDEEAKQLDDLSKKAEEFIEKVFGKPEPKLKDDGEDSEDESFAEESSEGEEEPFEMDEGSDGEKEDESIGVDEAEELVKNIKEAMSKKITDKKK